MPDCKILNYDLNSYYYVIMEVQALQGLEKIRLITVKKRKQHLCNQHHNPAEPFFVHELKILVLVKKNFFILGKSFRLEGE
jgi:hypothetical protein